MGGFEGPYVISGRETELESSASLRLAELERGSMVSRILSSFVATPTNSSTDVSRVSSLFTGI